MLQRWAGLDANCAEMTARWVHARMHECLRGGVNLSYLIQGLHVLAALPASRSSRLASLPWTPPHVPPLQYTLYHLFGYAYGSSTFLLAKLAGVADKALMPITLLTLKVRWVGWKTLPHTVQQCWAG